MSSHTLAWVKAKRKHTWNASLLLASASVHSCWGGASAFAASSAARVISAWTQAKEVSTQYHEDSMAAGVYFGSFADKYIKHIENLDEDY